MKVSGTGRVGAPASSRTAARGGGFSVAQPDAASGAHYARLRDRYESVLDRLEGAFHAAR